MNLRWIWLNHLRGMPRRWTRTALTVLAVGAGAALAVGVVITNHSISTTLDRFNRGVSLGATFRVEGAADHGGLDEALLPSIAATPGVGAAVPLVVTVAEVTDTHGHDSMVPVIGADCSIEALVGSFHCDPAGFAATTVPMVSPALQQQLGTQGVLHTDISDVRTDNAFAVKGLGKVNHGAVAVFPLATAQRQFGRVGGLNGVLIKPAPGADVPALRAALRQVVGPQNHVRDAAEPIGGVGFDNITGTISPFLFLISIIGLVIGAQLVRNTLDLTLEERRREFATASALGAKPRDVLAGILSESVVIGAFGSLLAVGGGAVIATAFVSKLSDELQKASGLRTSIATPGSAWIIGLVTALGVSVLASIAPARRAARLDLVAELSGRTRFNAERTASRVALGVSALLLAATMVLGWTSHRGGALSGWQPPASIAALVGSVIVGYVLCVQVAPRLLTMLQRAPGFSTGPARVALTNIVRARRRTVAIAIAITAPVFFSTTFAGIAPGMGDAAKANAYDTNHGNVYVNTLASNNSGGIDSKVTPEMERAIAAVPGVAAITHDGFGVVDDVQLGLLSVDAFEGEPPTFAVYRGAPAADVFARGEVMVGPALARRLHLAPGDAISLPARSGPRQSFVVGGIWASPNNLGSSITVTTAQLTGLYGPRPAELLRVVPVAGVTGEELAARLRAAHIDPRLHIMTTDEYARDLRDEFLQLASPFNALRGALVAVALVATASTLVLAAAQRRRDNATLAALGMSPNDLARSTVIETVLTALVVTAVATTCAQLSLLNFTWASGLLTGLPIPYRFSAQPVVMAAAVTALIALAGAALPAWRTARTDVMEALRTA
ncbi:MAG: putative transport system permease protein [Actinomycetota bacterium]|jgi:putative ABC transport system permease protein